MSGAAAARRGFLVPLAVLGVAVLLPLAVLLGVTFLFGWKLQVLESESMAPRYPKGSLAVIEPIDPADVRPGMTIVFEDPIDDTRIVAHRIVARVSTSPPAWTTQGDANATADPLPVPASAVRGRVRWAIPRLGLLVTATDGPLTAAGLVGVPLTILAVTEIRAMRRRRRRAEDPMG